ncbi:MAG: hypothetical protein ACK5KQ_07015 [Anaerorhabdus sp.]
MKKLYLLFIGLSLLLVGCSDANVSLTDPNTELFKVGKDSITKDDLYDMLIERDAGYSAISISTNYILDQEVEITDEIKKAADDNLSLYETIYQDKLLEAVQANGFLTIDDFYENNLLTSERLNHLTKKYIDANFDVLKGKYQPKKIQLLTFDNEESATNAKTELEKGVDIATIVEDLKSSSNGKDTVVTNDNTTLNAAVVSYVNDTNSTGISEVISDSEGSSFFVINITETNADNMKEEVIDTLSSNTTISTESELYFFTKYGLNVYDRTLHDLLTTNYPQYLK